MSKKSLSTKLTVSDWFCGAGGCGYAFQTRVDAQRRIDEAHPDEGFAVFGLDASWEDDTEPNQNGGWWHNLIRNADIIVLED